MKKEQPETQEKKGLVPSGYDLALIICTAAFVCLLLGLFLGRALIPAYRSVSVHSSQQSASASMHSDGKININTASAALLTQLPGIGQTTAERIVAYREENGPFTAPEELLAVSGIGKAKLEALREYITIGD